MAATITADTTATQTQQQYNHYRCSDSNEDPGPQTKQTLHIISNNFLANYLLFYHVEKTFIIIINLHTGIHHLYFLTVKLAILSRPAMVILTCTTIWTF